MATWPGASTITDLTGQVFICSSGAANKSEITAATALAGLAAVSSDVAAVRTSLAAAGTGVANTFTTGPQVFVGGATIRQSGGTAGVDEVQIRHDGSKATIENKESGDLVLLRPGSVETTFGSTGIIRTTGGVSQRFDCNGTVALANDGAGVELCNSFGLRWSDGAGWISGSKDLGFFRTKAGVAELSTGARGGAGATLRSIPLTPSQITSNQNDYAPGVARFYRLSTDASRDVTGLSISQVDGQEFEIWNVGSNNLVLKHQSASSTAANRFICTGAADITLAADEIALVRYDSTTARFRVRKV